MISIERRLERADDLVRASAKLPCATPIAGMVCKEVLIGIAGLAAGAAICTPCAARAYIEHYSEPFRLTESPNKSSVK